MNNLLKWWGANTVYAFIRYDLTLFWQNPDEQGKQASPDANEQIVSKQFALSCSSCSPSLCVNALGGWPPAKQVQSLWCFEGGLTFLYFWSNPTKSQRQLDRNHLTGCYVNAFLCFHPKTIDSDQVSSQSTSALADQQSRNLTSGLCSCLSWRCLLNFTTVPVSYSLLPLERTSYLKKWLSEFFIN